MKKPKEKLRTYVACVNGAQENSVRSSAPPTKTKRTLKPFERITHLTINRLPKHKREHKHEHEHEHEQKQKQDAEAETDTYAAARLFP